VEATTSSRRGDRTAEVIRRAAIRLFFRHGYEATSLRDLASEVGITVGSLYNHLSSKEDLLYSIMSGVMAELHEGVERAVESHTEPVARLRAAIEFHVSFHATRAQEVVIGNSELRSLAPTRRASVVESRDAYEAVFRRIVEDGVRAKALHAADVRLATYGILAMGTHVADWYSPRGRLSLDEIASVHSDFALRALTTAERQVALRDVLSPAHDGGA
jgi:AcrR family transcriptional regulator